jgi:hypothetical protein
MLFISTQVSASFLPKNDLYIPVGDKSAGGITEVEFNEVISKVDAVYKPIIASKGATLVFERNWTDGTVNAYANQAGKIWTVAMFGGLARSKEVTYEGFALVVCHEMGHHLGGAPKYKRGGPWASNEGQSDYWSTLKCFRKVFGQDPKVIEVPAMVTDLCSKVWKNEEDMKVCEHSISGGQSLAELLASLGGETVPTLDTPDKTKVTTTSDPHPAAQCRLDTYVAGSLCDMDEFVDVSDKDVNVGTCKSGLGARPLCWYAPKAKRR